MQIINFYPKNKRVSHACTEARVKNKIQDMIAIKSYPLVKM